MDPIGPGWSGAYIWSTSGSVIAVSLLVYNLPDVQAVLLSNVHDALGAFRRGHSRRPRGPMAVAASSALAAATFVINPVASSSVRYSC